MASSSSSSPSCSGRESWDVLNGTLGTREEVSLTSGLWLRAVGFDAFDCDLVWPGGWESEIVYLCVPASSESSWPGRSSLDLALRSRRDSTPGDRSRPSDMYESTGGRIRRNGIEIRFRIQVPRANKRRKRPVSSLKRTLDIVDQKKALKPKAANGNAVAVPRCSGKFDAAAIVVS